MSTSFCWIECLSGVPFAIPQVLSVEATPFHKVVRHASQFLVRGRCPISHLGEGRQGSQ
jgi:hypothetical protein